MSSPYLGIMAAFKRLIATLLDIGQVRLALLGTELELEKRRIFDGLLWGGVSLIVLGVALALLCGFAIQLFAQDQQIVAIGLMALLLLFIGWALMHWARLQLRGNGDAFDLSIAELRQDRMDLDKSACK